MEFINNSNLQFNDISSEEFRTYHFPKGEKLFIKNPLFLHVSLSGGHRIFDKLGNSYYIKPDEGWYIKWKAKKGEPNFVK